MTTRSTPQVASAPRLARAVTAWLLLALAAGASQATAISQASIQALTAPEQAKIASDLRKTLVVPALPAQHTWARDIAPLYFTGLRPSAGVTTPARSTTPAGTVRFVKALVFCDCLDPEMESLREAVVKAGGSVYMRYLSVRGLSVMLPASGVLTIAQRSDVQSISPNRQTTRSFSVLEQSVNINAGSTAVRAVSGPLVGGVPANYSGRTGAGVGIAILDSGIMRNHDNFRDATGASRVRMAVDFTVTTDASAAGMRDWRGGMDNSEDLLTPGSSARAAYEARIDNFKGVPEVDGYGHGTHVAGVAAGRAWGLNPNSSGVAPGALLYDLKVLDNNGLGTVSDVLAAIDWVVMRARELNIRVMNLSLAADSTESYVTDPLCRAVRSATAVGITVVVAAGNFGKRANGQEVYGTIGSPGHEPSVITVGSANTKGTAMRRDDVVNGFSSRGPTRGDGGAAESHERGGLAGAVGGDTIGRGGRHERRVHPRQLGDGSGVGGGHCAQDLVAGCHQVGLQGVVHAALALGRDVHAARRAA